MRQASAVSWRGSPPAERKTAARHVYFLSDARKSARAYTGLLAQFGCTQQRITLLERQRGQIGLEGVKRAPRTKFTPVHLNRERPAESNHLRVSVVSPEAHRCETQLGADGPFRHPHIRRERRCRAVRHQHQRVIRRQCVAWRRHYAARRQHIARVACRVKLRVFATLPLRALLRTPACAVGCRRHRLVPLRPVKHNPNLTNPKNGATAAKSRFWGGPLANRYSEAGRLRLVLCLARCSICCTNASTQSSSSTPP